MYISVGIKKGADFTEDIYFHGKYARHSVPNTIKNILMFGVRRIIVKSFAGHINPSFDKRSNVSGSDSSLMSFGKIIGMQQKDLAMIQYHYQFVVYAVLN